ncbi:MAG: signal peptide peptidase SppA [Nanoarchaeota archaeon]|nr:signal peptide peptidase SppA [Nanoarchaeota archaeon]
MKKREERRSKAIPIILTVVAAFVVLFILLPLSFSLFDSSKFGNVALIPLEGVITSNGGKMLGEVTVSSADIIQFVAEAEENPQVKAIVLEINSPGGSAVASDEIAAAIKKAEKPVIALIREVGASGGYWVASAADHIVANRMSITGSIGVISSYLEFSGLMEDYGVGYEQLTAGKYKDMGVPYRKLQAEEKDIFQSKLNTIHSFFKEEIAKNRKLSTEAVETLATGEFFLGVEALSLGLVDELGDKTAVEAYLKNVHGLESVDYVEYRQEVGFFELFSGVFSSFSFSMGEGFASLLLRSPKGILLT